MSNSPTVHPQVQERVALFQKQARTGMAQHIGIEYIELSAQKIVARMPVDERTMQPFGVLHGGASVALAETVASIGAWLSRTEEDSDAFGMEINANHLRPVSSGFVTATATPVHTGRSSQVWDVRITDEQERLVCISRCTLALVKKSV